MILFRRLHVVLIILGLSVNFGYGQDEADVGAPLGEEDVGSAKGLILLKGLKGLAKLKLFKGLLKEKWKLGLTKGFLLGKIVGGPNPFGGGGETADETADYFFEEAPEDVQASLWGGQQFDPDFHPERSPYHMNHQYNYNVQQNARNHEQNLGAAYHHPQYHQYNNVDENMYRTMENPEFSIHNYPQYYGYQPNYDPYEYEGMQASNLEPVQVKGPNDDLYVEMENAARNYYQGANSEYEAKSRQVRQDPVGPDPRAPYRTPDFMLQGPNPTQPNLQPSDQPIMWYSFNEGSKPYAIDFNYETSQYRNPTEQQQTPKETYKPTASDEVGAPNPVHDHMSHIPEEDQNVNPIIMQEYVSSVHGYNYDQQKNYNNQKKRTNDLEKNMSTDVNSKNMKHEETKEILNENSVSSSMEFSTSSKSETHPYETYAKKERDNQETMADTTKQQSPQMKNPRLEKRQETKRQNYGDVTKMKSEQSDNKMNSFMGQQKIHETPQSSDSPQDFKKMMETLQTLPGNQKEMFGISEKTSYQQDQKPGAPEVREVYFNGEKAVEYRYTSPEEAVITGDSQMYYDPNPARSMYQQYTPSVSQDQNGEIFVNEQNGRAIVVSEGSMPVTTPTEGTRMMQPEFVDPTSPYGIQYQYQPELQPQYRFTEDDPSTMLYSYDGMQYRMPMNGQQPQFFDAQQPLEEMTPQMPEHERTFHKGNLFGVLKYNGGYGGYPPGKLANKKGKGYNKYSHQEYSSYDSHHYGGYSQGGGHGYGGYSHGGGHGGYSHGGGHGGYSHGSGHGGYSHGSGHGGYSHGGGYGHGHGYGHGYVSQPNPTEFSFGLETYTTPVMKRSASLHTDLVASETTNEHPVVKRQDCKCPQTWGPPPPPSQDYVAGPYQGRNPEDVGSPFTQILGKPYLGFWGPAGFAGQWLFRPAAGRPYYGTEDHYRYERAVPNFLKKDNDQKLVPGMRFKKQLYKSFKNGPLVARLRNDTRENDIKDEKDIVNTEK